MIVQITLLEKTIKYLMTLMDDNKDICLIMVAGTTGTGKSTTLNNIAKFFNQNLTETDLLKVGNSSFSETIGINIINKKLYYQGV